MNTKSKGNIFEAYVENLYQSLGFKTKRNEILFGQEVDIIAEKYIDGVGEILILIECKFLEKGKVSNQIVIDFLSYLKSLPTEIRITRGVIITNSAFSPQSKLVSDKLLNLVLVDELEKEILDLTNPYFLLKRQYENENIFTNYIPLNGKIFRGTHEAYDFDETMIFDPNQTQSDPKHEKYKLHYSNSLDLEKDLLSEIRHGKWGDWGYISILGDYGSGKTTLMRRLFYRLNCLYLQNEISFQPIYIELKYFYRFKDLDIFIHSAFAKLFNKEISIELLKKEIDKGKFVFLLDGFDEMSPQISKQIRLENFNALFPLITSCLTLITCRPSYFLSTKEYNSYLEKINNEYYSKLDLKFKSKPSSLQLQKKVSDTYSQLFNQYFNKPFDNTKLKENLSVFVNELSDSQIDTFLQKYDAQFTAKCKSDWKKIKEFLLNIYDLSELMSRPLLLTLIKDTILLEGEKYNENTSLQYGPAGLYEVYTNLNLDFDWQKGETRYFLSKEQRREFAEGISIVMFDQNILEVEYKDLLNVIESNQTILNDLHNSLPSIETEHILSDIQICSFITRTQEDKFKFVHKSFMEFFIARVIKNIIVNDLPNPKFTATEFPKEVLYFIGSFALLEISLKNKLYKNINIGRNKILRRNYTVAYLYSSPFHENISLKNILLNEININKVSFSTCNYLNIQFQKTSWKNSIIKNSNFKTTIIDDSDINFVNFNQINGDLKIANSRLDHFEITGDSKIDIDILSSSGSDCEIRYTKLLIQDTIFEKSKFSVTDIVYTTKTSNNIFESCAFFNCNITIEKNIRIINCTLEKVIFLKKEDNILQYNKSNFVDCEFQGLELNADTLDSLHNCKGLVFIKADEFFCKREKLKFDRKGFYKKKELTILNTYQYGIHYKWVRKIIERAFINIE